MPLSAYLIVSAILFTVGVVGVLIRRNPLIIFMSIELMLNAVNLSFVAISSKLDSADGQMFVFIVLTVAAAVATVGSWKEKRWGYILAVLLCARENIVAVRSFYSQPG